MQNLSILYIPIGRKTFDLEEGNVIFNNTIQYLNTIFTQVYIPNGIITSIEELEQFLLTVPEHIIDIIIYQSITFADAEFIVEIMKYSEKPVLVWSVREPSVGGRLRLNSLTGGNSTSHSLKNAGHPYKFVFGNPEEEILQESITANISAFKVLETLKKLVVFVIGDHPPGFFFSGTNETQLKEVLGVEIRKLDLYEAFEKCVEIPEEVYQKELNVAEQNVIGLQRREESVIKFAQFTSYVRSHIEHEKHKAIAVRCWPDFFNELGVAACSTLSHFTDEGTASSCESDIHGAVTMFILQELSNGPSYLGDLVHIDEERNTATLWHCGAGAYRLANPKTGAVAGVHPNRKMGLTMEFGLKGGIVTIARLSMIQGQYKMFVMSGEALDSPQQFKGTSVEIKLSKQVRDVLDNIMDEGLEPHFSIVYGDVKKAYITLAKLLGIDVIEY